MSPDAVKGINRILVTRMDNIGDVVMTSPALRAIRKAYPNSELTLLASPAGAQVAPMLPWVNKVISWKAVWQDVNQAIPFQPERETRFIQMLAEKEFDLALVYTSFSQTPYPIAYACYLAGIPNRVGLSKEFGGGVLSHSIKPPEDSGHQVDRNLLVNKAFGIPADGTKLELAIPPEFEERAERLLFSIGIDPYEPYILFAPGASCKTKRYPSERAAEMIRKLVREIMIPVVIAGSKSDITHIQPILNLVDDKRILSLVARTNVLEYAALIKHSGFVIANNSSAMHLADAFEKPMLIFFSGTDYRSQWMPRYSPAVLLKRETHCSPCYLFTCPYQMECLDVSSTDAAEIALRMLHKHLRVDDPVEKPI